MVEQHVVHSVDMWKDNVVAQTGFNFANEFWTARLPQNATCPRTHIIFNVIVKLLLQNIWQRS